MAVLEIFQQHACNSFWIFYHWISIITFQLSSPRIKIIIMEKVFCHENKSVFLLAQSRIKLISVEATTQNLGKTIENFLESQFHVEKICRQLTQILLKVNLDETRYSAHLLLDFSCTVKNFLVNYLWNDWKLLSKYKQKLQINFSPAEYFTDLYHIRIKP